ncbi:MAG: threonylcarbamoyl-AMP synthase [Polaromonas sp.]|nr:threonylcarbamoyl-AMP synthase [Gemmatimonadaceae bacterium]
MTNSVNRADAIVHAAHVLSSGGLVAFPTETVYGLGADAENVGAVERIFAVKGRPPSHPLIVHIGASEQVEDWAAGVLEPARFLAERFWPGPLTLVLRRSARVPLVVTGGLETVALRVPDHPVALALLQAFGGAVAAPSANRFGSVSPTSARHVREELGRHLRTAVDVVLDGGSGNVGVESTIVDCTGEHVAILRPGGVTREDLERALGYSVPIRSLGSIRAPGQYASHYAPRARVILVEPDELAGEARRLQALGSRVGALTPRAFERAVADGHVVHILLVPESMTEYAQQLYELLREFDRRGCDVIVAALPPEQGLGLAIADRLRRAAGP